MAGLADIVPSIETQKYFDSNVTGTFNVLRYAKEAKVKNLYTQLLLLLWSTKKISNKRKFHY